ncbi:MAG: methylated-DNA--[protein]-cysteine S-methyltransferase, partial [Gammaproteobacteria bacterium]|nr:methylated-DNA--[protein]-cysteine S-methyltransferase [Gammaproteobacteria bacterium]
MKAHAYTLFDTAIGRCAVAWSEAGIAGVHLPEARDSETRAQLLRRLPRARETAPGAPARHAIDAIVALLQGEPRDLSPVTLDLDGVPPFHRRVYAVARAIAPGDTLTYGAIATRLGTPGAARAVGQALGRNPFAIVVPCHRVLAAGGRVGGFSARGGVTTKLRLLAIEAAHKGGTGALFDGDGRFGFDADTAVQTLRAADAALDRLMDEVGPFRMRLDRTPNLFLALAEAIVYQQLTGKAAATIFARVKALFPQARQAPTAAQILRVSDDRLRGAGLSRAKVLALRDLARRTVDGALPTLAELERLEDGQIIEQLTRVRGIGRWTVEMLLMFRLGRPDVLPLDDYAIRKGYAIALGKRELPTRKQIER